MPSGGWDRNTHGMCERRGKKNPANPHYTLLDSFTTFYWVQPPWWTGMKWSKWPLEKQPESKQQYILGHKYTHLEEKTIHVAKDLQTTLENRKHKLLCVPVISFEVQLVFPLLELMGTMVLDAERGVHSQGLGPSQRVVQKQAHPFQAWKAKCKLMSDHASVGFHSRLFHWGVCTKIWSRTNWCWVFRYFKFQF